MIPNTLKSPTTPHVPQSRPGSYAGWYDNASVFSQINLEETQSLAYIRSPDAEAVEHITSPVAISSRERVRSIRKERRTVQQEGTRTQSKGAHSRSIVSHESAIASSQALGGSEQTEQPPAERREKERLTILLPENYKNPVQLRKEEPGSTIRQRPSPHTALPDTQATPMTADKVKARKGARLTRLIVEKIILKVDESPVTSSGGDLEEGQQGLPKVRSYKLKPVQIALENLLPTSPDAWSSWAVTEVFHGQLSDRLAPSMVFENGSVPLLALASLVLLFIALMASVLPVLLAWIRSQYHYHEKNSAVSNVSVGTVDHKTVAKSTGSDEKGEASEDKETTEEKAKKRLTMIGKRMTKIFGAGDTSSQQKDGSKENDDREYAWEELKEDAKRTDSPVEVEADAKRKTLLKRLTLKTKSVVG
ncbi:hypothetical protein QFC20_000788 [Naganishia adeliensis]|uniref:Uncharacterized protein n=1 Tax=Naganishia adeliensis TaxID=92952 RepID=A0ACC2WZ71_9TREE|nr:hypothetical protein QFC20_000788 [Naganishia adeliensis]